MLPIEILSDELVAYSLGERLLLAKITKPYLHNAIFDQSGWLSLVVEELRKELISSVNPYRLSQQLVERLAKKANS